jgi:hypothetical protein
MQLANRAIVAGIDTAKSLPTIFDFASKKAVTTGMDFGGAMERIIMGLSRGSAAILDDFGLLNDGLEGVQRSYEAIKGKGAWEQLGTAAQKAEIIRQAMEDMHRQLGRIGVRGTETVFVWKQIKTQIGDATDKLFAAIGRSDALKGALIGIRDVIGGMTRHFEKGGSLGELLFGKEGGASGGLFGGLKAGVLDLGELLGRGILGGLLKGISLIPDLLNSAWEGLKSAWTWAIEELPPRIISAFEWLKTDFLPALKDTLTEWRQETINALAGWLKGYMVTPEGKPTAFGRLMGLDEHGEGWPQRTGKWIDRQLEPWTKKAPEGYEFDFSKMSPEGWERLKRSRGATTQPAGVGMGYGFGVIPAALAAATGVVDNGPFGKIGQAGSKLLRGGVLGGKVRLRDWLKNFSDEFPAKDAGPLGPPRTGYIPDEEFALSLPERQRRRAALSRMDRDLADLDPGSSRRESVIRREAWKRTQAEVRRLRESGRVLRRGDTGRIRRRIAETLRLQADAERKRLMEERGRMAGDMADNGPAGRRLSPTARTGGQGDKSLGYLEQISRNTAAMVAAIGGVERAGNG